MLYGCETAEAGSSALPNSYSSPGRLADAALTALIAGDREALEAMRITREEYETHLWDQLPESSDLPIDYVWMLNDRNSRNALNHAIEAMSGTEFRLMDVQFTRPSESYDGFTVHFGAEMLVQRAEDGAQGEIPLLDVMVEKDGGWKLLNFSD